MKKINYGGQHIDDSDIEAVKKSLKKKVITSGSSVSNFEKKINSFLKCKFSTVCNSGTSAIFLALKSLNLKKDDKILMPAVNFISAFNVTKILGAHPILIDVDETTGQVTPEAIDKYCRKNKLRNFKALIVMYNGGYPLNAENFFDIKKKYKCFVIEDACHALGASYQYKKNIFKIGSCKHSDICTFSLHPLKTITTGEGGIVTTNNKTINKKIKFLRSHGIIRNKKKHWEYNVIYNSLNFRLTDFQCELGISQLKKINKFINRRRKISYIYEKKLYSIKNYVSFKFRYKFYNSAYHLLLIKLKKPNIKLKSKLIKFMLKKNVMLQYHYIPIYKFKIFNKSEKLKGAESYYQTTVSLPIFYTLSERQINYIVNQLHSFFKLNA